MLYALCCLTVKIMICLKKTKDTLNLSVSEVLLRSDPQKTTTTWTVMLVVMNKDTLIIKISEIT